MQIYAYIYTYTTIHICMYSMCISLSSKQVHPDFMSSMCVNSEKTILVHLVAFKKAVCCWSVCIDTEITLW